MEFSVYENVLFTFITQVEPFVVNIRQHRANLIIIFVALNSFFPLEEKIVKKSKATMVNKPYIRFRDGDIIEF